MYMIRLPMFLGIGLRRFTKGGYERAERNFKEDDLNVDMKGKVVMVTGGNQGIGYSAAKALAKKGCTLYIVCRNETRGQQAVKSIRTETGNSDVHLCTCDMSSLADIKKLAAEFNKTGRPLHVLINNAGVMVNLAKSADGFEMNFATNTLGYYALTRALEPILKKSSPSRVIFVASGGALTEPLEVEDLEGLAIQSQAKFQETQYARDKRRQVAIAEGLAREWQGSNVGIYSMHPGWAETEGVKSSMPDFYNSFQARLRTPDQAADTIVWLAAVDSSKLTPGEFYLDRAPQSKHLPLSRTSYPESAVTTLMKKLDVLIQSVIPK